MLKTRAEWTDVREVLGAAIKRVERRLGTRTLTRDFPAELSLIPLDPALLVYPAHDYKGRSHSTIGVEIEANPRLQKRDRTEFVQMMRELNLAAPTHLTEALRTNMTGGKTVLNFILLTLGGKNFDTAFAASLFLSPVGEFSFVIAGAGLAAEHGACVHEQVARLQRPKIVVGCGPRKDEARCKSLQRGPRRALGKVAEDIARLSEPLGIFRSAAKSTPKSRRGIDAEPVARVALREKALVA